MKVYTMNLKLKKLLSFFFRQVTGRMERNTYDKSYLFIFFHHVTGGLQWKKVVFLFLFIYFRTKFGSLFTM